MLDTRLQLALVEARVLEPYWPSVGAEYEDAVRQVLSHILPASFATRGTYLAGSEAARKQLDVVAHAWDLPSIYHKTMPMDVMALVGEVKTRLGEAEDIPDTACRLAKAAVEAARVDPVPFFVLTGELQAKGKARRLSGSSQMTV